MTRQGQVWIRSLSRSDTSSSRPLDAPRARAAGGRARRRWLAAPAIAFAAVASAQAKVFMTQEEALALAFGGPGRAERRTAYLTDEQAERIRAAAGSPPSSRVITYYAGVEDPNRALTAYFDTHLVRTFPETVMIVVGADAKVRRVDILSFDEPEDYLPKARWLGQFPGRALDDDMSAGRGIRAVTGATLSSRAITAAVRRVLATHALLGVSAPAPGGKP
jgi:FMN-binding protein